MAEISSYQVKIVTEGIPTDRTINLWDNVGFCPGVTHRVLVWYNKRTPASGKVFIVKIGYVSQNIE